MELHLIDSMQIEIKPESPEDYSGIRTVNERSFQGPAEANLVELLRAHGKATLSLVASLQEQIVGHILFSPTSTEPPHPNVHGVGLAPLAVLSEYQNRGIGTQLVNAGLHACRNLDFDIVIVLGNPRYYTRFGFQRASQYGLNNEYDVDDAFMVLELQPGLLDQISGLVRYAPEFKQAGC